MDILFDPRETIVTACVVLFLGRLLNRRVSFFRNYNIPEPVTGGLFFSFLFGLLYFLFNLKISFSLELRDALLVIFFITIGLSSRLSVLKAGGKPLMILLLIAVSYLFLQNFTGIAVAGLLGQNEILGVIGGSISFSGGHGTAIAWAPILENDYMLANAMEIGTAFATFGLVIGGLVGGPIGKFLMKRYRLKPEDPEPVQIGVSHETEHILIDYEKTLRIIFIIFFTAGVGIGINDLLVLAGLELPSFVTALFAGIVVTNLIPIVSKRTDWRPQFDKSLSMASDLSLGLFLAMSLMSIQIWTVSSVAGTLVFIVLSQVLVIVAFTILLVFRFMGKDYDAAVICSGYSGLALGATPTAIANMTALTKKFGGSPKAFIVIPLVGAFFIDISNAFVIKFILSWLS